MEMKRTKDERPPLNEYVLGVLADSKPYSRIYGVKAKKVRRVREPS